MAGRKTPGSAVAAVVGCVLLSLVMVLFVPPNLGIPLSAPPTEAAPTDAGSFSFAAGGDFGGPTNGDMLAFAKRVKAENASFLLALGDLGYTSDEQAWCNAIKAQFNHVILIAGNHDTTESGPGDIANAVRYCTFTLGVPLSAGPGTPGYGYEYYFDYPSPNPLGRFIMITAGVTGNINYDFRAGSAHYNWVVSAVNDARTRGIPWVVVGLHKQCITVGSKTSCSMGQPIFDKLVDLKVDLILQAHDHVYERSKQLAISPACTSVVSGGNFDADCVVDDGADGVYSKGAGSVVVINGAGGQSLYTVNLGGSDREIGYFAAVMGGNANTQGKSNGHGPVIFTMSATRITAATRYCPAGSAGSDGQCPSRVATTFQDAFEIGSASPAPTARFIHSPTWARIGQPISFDASSSTDPDGGALEARWDWQDDGTWDTPWSTVLTASQAYATAGVHRVRLEVRDPTGLTGAQTRQVSVDGQPPTTSSSLSGTTGSSGWYRSSVSAALTATDDMSGIGATRYRLDSGTWQTYTGAVSVSGAGSHILEYNSTDQAGNWEATKSVQFKIDATAPTTSHSLAGTLVNGTWYASNVTVTLSASDATSGVATTKYRLNGGGWQTYASPVVVSGNGSHAFDYQSTDVAGNVEAVRSAAIQIGPPQGPVSTLALAGAVGANDWYVEPVRVTLTASDPAGRPITLSYRVDGGPWQTYSTPFVVGDGLHTVEYYATNDVGGSEPAKSASFKVDAGSPVTTHALGGAFVDGAYQDRVNVTLTATDATSGVAGTAYRVDGGAWATYSAPVSIAQIGSHLFEYASTDNAGNVEAAKSVSFTIRSTARPPVTTIQASGTRGASSWYTSNVTVILSASGGSGALTIQHRIDGGAWSAYMAPLAIGEGRHILEYYATDAVGFQEVVQSAAIDVDLTPPLFEHVSPSGILVDPEVDVHWEASDTVSGLAGFEVSIDGGPFVPLGRETSLRIALEDGDHYVALKAVDEAGNVEIQAIAFRVDTGFFSPTGPNAGVPLYLLIEFLLAVGIIGFMIRRRRKQLRRYRAFTRRVAAESARRGRTVGVSRRTPNGMRRP